MKIIKKRKANALITVLAVLLVISTMAVSFARVAGSERLAASNFGESLKARLLSEAGLNFGISQLRRDFQQEVMCTVQAFTDKTGELKGERRWTATALNDPNPATLTSTNMHLVEDDMAAGIPIEDLQRIVGDNTIKSDTNNPQLISPHPSYAPLDQDLNVPKPIPGTNLIVTRAQKTLPNATVPTYTLKVISLNSQIDLNSQTPQIGQSVQSLHLATMLNNLSIAISKRKPYVDKFPDDIGKGPLFSTIPGEEFLGQKILALRDKITSKSFTSKYQILELKGMDREKAVYLWDFICANPIQEAVLSRPTVLNALPTPQNVINPPVNELEEYRLDSRSPININLAPWPVLVATFSGLECVDSTGDKITISPEDAEALASRICRERRRDRRPENNLDAGFDYPFAEWAQFQKYMLREQNEGANQIGALDVFSNVGGEPRKKALLIYAMADPNVHLRRTNPDAVLFQEINKVDITKPTLELSFYPHGLFEITSLGQIVTTSGTVTESHKRQVVVKIFDLIKKNSQSDFNDEHILASTLGAEIEEFKQINSYTSGNNSNLVDHIQKIDLKNILSKGFGHVAPVNFDNQFLGSGSDSVNTKKSESGNLLFKCNFNGDNLTNGGPATPFNQSLNADFPLPDSPLPATSAGNFGGISVQPTNGLRSKTASKPLLPSDDESGNINEIGDLASDGVIFLENPDNSIDVVEDKTLCYLTKNNVPMITEIGGAETQGTVVFWFKLNQNKDWSKFRTCFFATTPMDEGGARGVQMEIQMKFDKDASNLTVQSRRKYYDVNAPADMQRVIVPDDPDTPEDESVDTYVSPTNMNSADYGAQKTFSGVKEHNWYCLAVRWQNLTQTDSDDIRFVGNDVNDNGSGDFEIENATDEVNPNPLPIVENVDFDNTLTNEELAPLLTPIDGAEVKNRNTARMYFGTVKRTYAPGGDNTFGNADDETFIFSSACTMDDIRIVEEFMPNSIVFSRFAPTPFDHVANGETKRLVGMFSGEFSGFDKNRTILGIFDWTRRVPEEFDDGSFTDQPFTQGEFTEDDFANEGANNVNSFTEYITNWNPKEQQKKPMFVDAQFQNVDRDVLEEIRNFILVDNNGNPDRGLSAFGRELSDIEYFQLFTRDLEEAWDRFVDENNPQVTLFSVIGIPFIISLPDLDDTDFPSTVRKAFQQHPDLLNRLRNVKQEIVNAIANGGIENEEPADTGGEVVIDEDFPLPVSEEDTVERVEIPAEEFIDPVSQKAFGALAINPLGAKNALQGPQQSIAKAAEINAGESSETEVQKVIISPEKSDFQYNLMFLQDQLESGSSAVKVAFSSPVIDDVSMSFQTKILFFYNIELFE